jgi:hypothetical protein
VTIVWDTQNNAFQLTDNIVDGQTQTAITAGASTISTSPPVTVCTVYRGRLPIGLSLLVDPSGNFVSIVGTPTEAGYFDIWFRLTTSSGKSATLYHRLFVDYINPLVILTSSLPTAVTGQPYDGGSFQLQGFGGIPFSPPAQPYTWSITSTPAGMSFSTSTGTLSGTPTGGASTTTLGFTVTDSRGVTASRSIPFTIVNAVTIQTTVLPTIQIGVPYSFQVVAVGGTTPYNWTCAQLPLSGISINASTGVISGTTSSIITVTSITVVVQDSSLGTASKPFALQTGAQGGMSIDASGVGVIDRGAPYQGNLRAVGTAPVPYLPVSWRVDLSSPNPLPTGLTLQANSADQGVTAIISGSTTSVLTSYPVIISATDAIGNPASITLSLNTASTLHITTTSLPQGVVSLSYNGGTPYQLTAAGYNTPFTWSVISSTPTSFPYTLSSSGAISGTSGSAFNGSVVFQVADSLSPTDIDQVTLGLIVSASTLQITTNSPLAQGTAGVSYTAPLAATGGVPSYTWAVSPVSANSLPSGLSLATSTGIISGATSQVGTKVITFRVTDSIGSYVDKALSLTFISGLTLYTGIDYTDSLSTNYLGFIDTGNTASVNPRPNYSFYVVATGVITTSMSALQGGISISNSGFTATVVSLTGGVAYISISGPFSSGATGDNSFGITVVDSGVTVTGTFKWMVYSDGTLRAAATNTFPTQLTS